MKLAIIALIAILGVLVIPPIIKNNYSNAEKKYSISSDVAQIEDTLDTENVSVEEFLPFEDLMKKPDFEAIVPSDIRIRKVRGRILLLFTGAFWNKGDGPFELIRENNSRGKSDKKFDVSQRVKLQEGEIDLHVGTMLWHASHGHFHLDNMALYSLEAVDFISTTSISNKVSFCLRDMKIIDRKLENYARRSIYNTCGSLRQGLSVGWADIYDFTLPGQSMDITSLPLGEYRLSIEVDPEELFIEKTRDNNKKSVILSIDPARSRVKILKVEN